MSAIAKAVEVLGGNSATGRALKVSHEAVRRWLTQENDFAPERAINLEAAVESKIGREKALSQGLRCEDFLPGLEWERDLLGNVIAYRVPVANTNVVVTAEPDAGARQ